VTEPLLIADQYIDGKPIPGEGELLGVEDPATETEFTSVTTATLDQFDSAIAAARTAFDDGTWPRMPIAERLGWLEGLTAALVEHRDALVELTVRETGSPVSLAQWAQVGMALDHARQLIELYATLPEWEDNELPLDDRITPDGRDVVLSGRRYEPCGVVSVITPYNFPLSTTIWKVISALATGCTVVLRPSPLTPVSGLVFGFAAHEAGLPPGVLNVVAEADAAGAELLTSDPRVDGVSFTGSTAVGRLIAAQAAPTLKRLTLELGGKSVQLYLPDAIDQVVMGACVVFGGHAGQGCSLQTRVLVPDDALDDVVARVSGAAATLPVGDTHDPTTVVGPVISASHRDRIEALVARGVEAGGRITAGGGRPAHLDRGYFLEPTVMVVEDNANPVVQNEVFGPVITVQGFRDVDHAVALANDSEYGLSGGVYTGDLRLGRSIAERIRSGTVQVNRSVAAGAYVPFGGYKQSGIGREKGVAGFRGYQEQKHIALTAPPR
jgi:acyl-CoA reductase-like NAD-dependent aldehyde dehydrogenase